VSLARPLISVAVGLTLAIGSASWGGADSLAASTDNTTACPGAQARPGNLDKQRARRAIVCLINHRRKRHGLGSLSRDPRLQRSAQRHNRRMYGTGCWAHQCPGEASLEDRVREVGYVHSGLSRWFVAENLAYGAHSSGTPARLVDAWMHSPGHRHAILTGELRDVGVGFNRGTPGSKRIRGSLITADFGVRVP
jgi:uncharacterized protein YkwD